MFCVSKRVADGTTNMMCQTDICYVNSRGRPLGRWKNKVKVYMCERGATKEGGLDQTRKCFDRKEARHQSYRDRQADSKHKIVITGMTVGKH